MCALKSAGDTYYVSKIYASYSNARALYDSDSQVYDIDYHYIQAMLIDLRQKLNYPSQNLHY